MAGTLNRVSTAFASSQLREHFPNESTVLPATGRSVTSRAKDEPSNVPGSQVGAHTLAAERRGGGGGGGTATGSSRQGGACATENSVNVAGETRRNLRWPHACSTTTTRNLSGRPTEAPPKMRAPLATHSGALAHALADQNGGGELGPLVPLVVHAAAPRHARARGQATLTRRERARLAGARCRPITSGCGPRCRCTRRTAAPAEMRMLDLLKAVDAPTDEHRWFSPRRWPPSPASRRR